MTDVRSQARGELLVTLSNRIVAIYKELYGKGPVKVRSWYLEDVVLCVLRGGLTRSEQTLVELGRGDRVALQRSSFHEISAPIFMQAVEELTGRPVETVVTGTGDDHDVTTLVFLLEPPEAAALRATDEGLLRQRKHEKQQALRAAIKNARRPQSD